MPATTYAVGDYFRTQEELIQTVFRVNTVLGHSCRVQRRCPTYLTPACPNDECQWTVKAKVVEGECRVTKVESHTCAPGEARWGCDGTSDWISSILEEKVASQFDYGPKQAAIDLKSFRDVAVPKKTVERGLEKAKEKVHGLMGEQYGLIAPYLTDLQQRNSQMYWNIEKRDDGAFERVFWSFVRPETAEHLAPVICSDACSLTGPFGGCLFITVGIDAERHVMPLAYSVGVVENHEGWAYHHTHLKNHFGDRLKRFVLISDRQKGLESDTSLHGVVLHHALCVQHLVGNVASQTKIPKVDATLLVWKISKLSIETEAETCLQGIKDKYGKRAHRYLLKSNLESWSDAYWPSGVPRCNTYTSNASECVNAVFKETRQGSLLSVIKDTRCWTTDTYASRREMHADVPANYPVPTVELFVWGSATAANNHAVTPLGEGQWEPTRTRVVGVSERWNISVWLS